ncbi:hypothetical protein [Actinoplanes sp. NPDC026623]|uniref:hypothetical protein n=1 Tax=Actinoplanes sp. NPDC026623 TaxID=3155610 RepID=UPI0033C4E1ED
MSYLENSSFESYQLQQGWVRVNLPEAVQLVYVGGGIAKTGSWVMELRSSVPGGSMGQDVVVQAPSVSCFAWLRAKNAMAEGTLALWRLNTGHVSTAEFRVSTTWTLITNTLDLRFAGRLDPQSIRVEFYLNSVDDSLYIDSANLF